MNSLTNIESWQYVLENVAQYPDNATWTDWKSIARDFLSQGIDAHFDEYFRAGQSMHWILFSTLDHFGLRGEPHVTIYIRSRDDIEVSYDTTHRSVGGPAELSYRLPFDEAFATFHRFLLQLWMATNSDPIPSAIRGPDAPFNAPVLIPTHAR
jgi:hypothetical protein